MRPSYPINHSNNVAWIVGMGLKEKKRKLRKKGKKEEEEEGRG
jgi:hypothetical protein